MAPPIIHDDATLLEIAIITIRHPDDNFACVCRRATSKVPTYQHSDDSRRKRLQRKFNRDRAYWIGRGHDEIHKRSAAQLRQAKEILYRCGEQTRPVRDAAKRVLEATQTQFTSPDIQRLLKDARQMQVQLRKQFGFWG